MKIVLEITVCWRVGCILLITVEEKKHHTNFYAILIWEYLRIWQENLCSHVLRWFPFTYCIFSAIRSSDYIGRFDLIADRIPRRRGRLLVAIMVGMKVDIGAGKCLSFLCWSNVSRSLEDWSWTDAAPCCTAQHFRTFISDSETAHKSGIQTTRRLDGFQSKGCFGGSCVFVQTAWSSAPIR